MSSLQPQIAVPPLTKDDLMKAASSNDDITVNSWMQHWDWQVRNNEKNHGPLKDKGVSQLSGLWHQRPCVVVGSGPSLKKNAHLLKDCGLPIISCLHNFHLLEDLGVAVDFYVTLDAGPITIEEVSEGGTRSEDEYWELTKDRTLIAYAGTHPGLLEKWKGRVYFYQCAMPTQETASKMFAASELLDYIVTGGNVLGAAFYISKAFLGSQITIFVGADFSFSYDLKFHAWDSKYDKNIGHVTYWVDIYGNKVSTWQSYLNFKYWFDAKFQHVPGIYLNATEGGIMGAYREGNIAQVQQVTLAHAIGMFNLHKQVAAAAKDNEEDMKENPRAKRISLLF